MRTSRLVRALVALLAIAPATARGAEIALDDLGTGASLFERSQFSFNPLPGGGVIPFSCHQWRGNQTTYAYRELDKGCPSPPTNGRVRRVRIQDRRLTASDILVKYQVAGVTMPVPVGPVRTAFTFGSTAILSALGRCGAHTFTPTTCTLSGSKLACRQP